MTPETSARGESQSHGAAEQNVNIVAEFTRVQKIQVDDNTGLDISSEHAIYPWMARWAAMLSTRGNHRRRRVRGGPHAAR